MTIKKYYQGGKLSSIGFDTLEEVYAYNNMEETLEAVPSNEFILNEDNKNRIRNDIKFKKWVSEV